jgi:hypothetical protein
MSIPLERLYHLLADSVNRAVVIYRWLPHGSKNLQDLRPLRDYATEGRKHMLSNPIMICHDQEPLDYDLWSPEEILEEILHRSPRGYDVTRRPHRIELAKWHLRGLCQRFNTYDKTLLLHSEMRSSELEKYQEKSYIPVYYWSHALIARDWFRYAQHDPRLGLAQHRKFDFLIYNRAWSSTREYRLKFAEMLANSGLHSQCLTSFGAHDQGQHYTQHQFRNSDFSITRQDLEQVYRANTHSPNASADYNHDDYAASGLEVVLETMFDDSRWHLTEKILRPIACRKPFMLVSTPGSLEYLKSYGFCTFGDVIDESYDTLDDPLDRLTAIHAEMRRISALDSLAKQNLWHRLDQVAQHNQAWFFSAEFHDRVLNEYVSNTQAALAKIAPYQGGIRAGQAYQILLNTPNTSDQTKARLSDFKHRVDLILRGQDPGDF